MVGAVVVEMEREERVRVRDLACVFAALSSCVLLRGFLGLFFRGLCFPGVVCWGLCFPRWAW